MRLPSKFPPAWKTPICGLWVGKLFGSDKRERPLSSIASDQTAEENTKTTKEASMAFFPQEVWTTALDQLSQRIRHHFVRPEPHQRALAYLQGLMSQIPRKNGWQVAEEMGEATPYGMQHLLDRAKWDCDGVRDKLRTYVGETLADSKGVVVIDETGFLKKGGKSVGVQRQYSGTAGRIENCQVGVFLSYASARGHTLLDRELYLPKSWTDDLERCREADVPASVTFATKPELAQRMPERTLDSGLSVAWVTGDTIYGSSQKLRAALEARKQAYALAVPCKEYVEVQGIRRRVDQVARDLARGDWQELSAGTGSKGPRLFAWARIGLAAPEIGGWQRWLLIRRSLDEGANPAEMAYVLIFAPTGTSLEEMVEAVGARWTVEQCFEEAKGEVGLDEYEARSWQGWYRHVTLSMLALAFLTALRANGEEDVLKKSLDSLSRPQSQRRLTLLKPKYLLISL
jgi:SRSO17 transposase